MSVPLLTIATAGSVDDGKSTLIGRLLYETESLSADRIAQVRTASLHRGHQDIDFSLVTDGLIAEREQGITIDVAHLYFSSHHCDFIIADTPGHFEYTRNMVTGASRADIMVLLVDARQGIKQQSLRHLYLAGLLHLRQVIVAVNKMDLVEWDERRFDRILSELDAYRTRFGFAAMRLHGIPVSSLLGDNVTTRSSRMGWFKGQSLLELLKHLAETCRPESQPMRFMVQGCIRPRSKEYPDYRGIAGRLYGKPLVVGEEVVVLPSGISSRVRDIQFNGASYDEATPGSSCTVLLDEDIDVARGHILTHPGEQIPPQEQFRTTICHFARRSLQPGQVYQLQAGTLVTPVVVRALEACMRPDFSGVESATQLRMNDIGIVTLQAAEPICLDRFEHSRHTGSFILVDNSTLETCAAGLVL